MGDAFPRLLALDFDGVICDGLLEYFASTQRAYHEIWPDVPPEGLNCYADRFYQLRPVIESGWEMILLLRALTLGMKPDTLQHHWTAIAPSLQAQEQVTKAQLTHALDHVRDHWIHTDLEGWLSLHRFYPGILDQLKHWLAAQRPQWLYIVTTKEGRFVQQLLHNHGVDFPPAQILGKEIQQPKAQTLRQLCQAHYCSAAELWFVEDLFKTLESVSQQPDLDPCGLFLADWGYNTAAVRASLAQQPRFHRLSLAQFTRSFSAWLPDPKITGVMG